MKKKQMYLKSEMIYNYFIGKEEISTLVMCKPYNIDLITTDQSLYEALGSINDKDKLFFNKMVKFLENVEVVSFRFTLKKKRKILTEGRVKEIKKLANSNEMIDLTKRSKEKFDEYNQYKFDT